MAKSPAQVADTLGGLGRLTELRQRLLFGQQKLYLEFLDSYLFRKEVQYKQLHLQKLREGNLCQLQNKQQRF